VTDSSSVIQVKSWEECEERIRRLEAPTRGKWDELWFRGQSDARWRLETTLERRANASTLVHDYLHLISRIKPAIETFTGATWEIPDLTELDCIARTYDLFDHNLRRLGTYLAHLRHNGFPSPLLDWTRSPYVAAYFAFARARPDEAVALFVYRERPNDFKVEGSDSPTIISFGPILKTHKRHFRQQSRYTACAQFEHPRGWSFRPHESVLKLENKRQDLLWKIEIPSSERRKVLGYFDKFNLNEFTLFDSEEGLMEMLAMREMDLT
jgi:hypothetical protein